MSPSSKGFLEAAYQVLREAGRPLHGRDIVQVCLERGLWETEALDPYISGSTTLYAEISRRPNQRGFTMLGKAMFGLKEWRRAQDMADPIPVSPSHIDDQQGVKTIEVIMPLLAMYADYEIPLLLVLSELPNGQGSPAEVLRRFWARFQALIPPDYLVRVKPKGNSDLKWENIVRWTRNSLVRRGLMGAPAYGIWAITDAGRAHLAQAGATESHTGQTAQHRDPPVSPLKLDPAPKAPEINRDPEGGELSLQAFLECLHAFLEPLSREAGIKATVKAPADRFVQVFIPSPADCHYEIAVHARKIEVGLHFESSLDANHEHLAWFLAHESELRQVRSDLRVEKWGANRARIYLELPKGSLSVILALACVLYLKELIQATLPILRLAPVLQPKQPRADARPGAPSGVHAIADALVDGIRDFLHGRASRPTDERLCDWVNFCYEFGLYREGCDLFALVDPSQVNQWYYERTRRLAKVCAMKVAGQA